MSHPTRHTAILTRAVLVGAIGLGLTACQAGDRAVTSITPAAQSAAADTAAADTAAADATAAAAVTPQPAAVASTSAPATGSVTIAITSPTSRSGTVAAPVTCDTGRAYRATVTRATVDGAQVSFTVAVVGYRGPGTYPAIVGATVAQADTSATVAGVPRVPVTITSSGGSFDINATGSEGTTLAGSLSWVCG